MKKLLVLTLCIFILQAQLVWARTVEIKVYGMTCAFCVDGLERKFKQMPAVRQVKVSLKLKKVHLETEENKPSLEALKKAVINAGFTPTKVTILSDEKK